MRRRRKTSTLDEFHDLFLTIPWWVGLLVAAFFYALLSYMLPALVPTAGGALFSVAPILRAAALPVTGLILMVWLFAQLGKIGRRRLLESRSGLESLRELSWSRFEKLIGEAYRRRGYLIEECGGGGADGGVDLVLFKAGAKTLVQCKQWKSWKVGVGVVRELFGVMSAEGASDGMVVTVGKFTQEAKRWAERKPIRLVEGEELWEMVKDVQVGGADSEEVFPPAGTAARRMFRTGSATGTSVENSASCPVCSRPMVVRIARKGSNRGSKFWGCSGYPQCRGTRNID